MPKQLRLKKALCVIIHNYVYQSSIYNSHIAKNLKLYSLNQVIVYIYI